MIAYWIKAAEKTVEQVEYSSLSDLQRMVGGYITTAHNESYGDVLYVDDEGLFKGHRDFFTYDGAHQPFAGNGVFVGKEIADTIKTRQPKHTLAEVTSKVKFLTVGEALRASR